MPTILIVDDDERNLKTVSDLVSVCMKITNIDMTIVHASHGAEAWAQITKPDSNVSVVISDVEMPNMSGPELSKRIHEMHPEITVILISGRLEPEHHKAHAFIGKPLTMSEMLRVIRRLMKQK